jgi:hypothetical protein
MKKALFLVLTLLSTAVFADTSAVERLLYDGYSTVEEMNLSTEKTRVEYRTVRVPATCYRTEYRQRCTTRPPQCRTVCDRNGNCRNRCAPAQRVCNRVPVQVAYRCMRNERRAFQVHDYFVETNVQFQFNTADVSDIVREEFTMRMVGERATLSAIGSKNYFLVLDRQSRNESRSAGYKYVNLVYKVNLVPAARAQEVLRNGIQNVKLRSGILTFNLGAGFNLRSFTQEIKIFQNRRFGTDYLVLDKRLSGTDMNVQGASNSSLVTIDLNSLGVNVPSKLRVILDTKFDIDERKILNRGQLKSSANANWIFR